MFTVRRWWTRRGSQVVLIGLVLSTAWLIRQTQGAVIAELYHWTVRPLQSSPTPEERLTNARVEELQQRLIELENQNQKLKELLDYVETQKEPVITAPIVGRSADHWWQQVTLGRGQKEGVEVGFIVMGTGGLVGQVVSVTPHTSRVLLVSDPTSSVGAIISRSRYMGVMRGQGSNRAVIQFFEKVPDVRQGDAVATSPVSRLFPSGLPVGHVESINLDKSPAPEATIELTAPVKYLEWVVVYPFEK